MWSLIRWHLRYSFVPNLEKYKGSGLEVNNLNCIRDSEWKVETKATEL